MASTTLFTFRLYDANVASKVSDATLTKSGTWDVVAYNSACMLIREVGVNNFRLARYDSTGGTWTEEDLSTIMTGVTLDANTNELISPDCNRMRFNRDIIFLNSGTSQWEFIGGSSGAFTYTDINDNLDIALVTDKIFKFNGVSAFAEYGPISGLTLLTENLLYATGSMVIVASRSTSAVEMKAFKDNGDGTYTQALTHSDSGFTATPTILVSPAYSKTCITGVYIPTGGSSAAPKIDCFSIDFPAASSLSFAFPVEAIADPTNTDLQLGDSVIYIRQTTSVSGSGSTASGNTEALFYLSDDIYP